MKCVFLVGYLLLLVGFSSAEAHDEMILKCSKNVPVDAIHKLKEEVLENGLIAEFYDRVDWKGEFDGSHDLIAYSSPSSAGHMPYPIYYEVDLDFDGNPDKKYQDVRGIGQCKDIIETDDYNSPGEHESLSEMKRWLAEGL